MKVLSRWEAAELLGVGERTFRRWRDQREEGGDAGLVDGRHKPANYISYRNGVVDIGCKGLCIGPATGGLFHAEKPRMSSLANHPFAKMNGIGNQIIVLDLRASGAGVTPAAARAIAAAPGLAYDQMMVLHPPRSADTLAYMSIFNNDGSLSAACGNGTRCVAYILTRDTPLRALALETSAGRVDCARDGGFEFTVDMGAPRLDWRDIPLAEAARDTGAVRLPGADLPPAFREFSAVNMGNPHAVFFVSDAAAQDLAKWGPRLEIDPMFPEKANISFAQVVARDRVILRVWERGAGATLACGTAACAVLVAGVRAGLTDRAATIMLPGGELRIQWREGDGHVLMSGPVELEFEGAFDPAIFEGQAL